MTKPIVAIVGRPNVGKSTLFNRLVGKRQAIVEDIPGTTRDRVYADTAWRDREFTLVDTGGLEFNPEDIIRKKVQNQANIALAEADVILFLVDAADGITIPDIEVSEALRIFGKPVILAANKADNDRRREYAFQFHELGIGEPIAISAYHDIRIVELMDRVVDLLPPSLPSTEQPDMMKIAIVGRPNVGKSMLLNALIGEERAIVSEIPGTTRDTIDTIYRYDGEPVLFIDTAGIRRRGKIDRGIEKYSVMRALRAISRADIVLLVIEAKEGFTAQDAHIAGYAQQAHVGMILLVNKWDLAEQFEKESIEFTAEIQRRLRFFPGVPILFISALYNQGTDQIFPTARHLYEETHKRVPTGMLNDVMEKVVAQHAPPSIGGKQLKISYVTQAETEPPTFIFFVNNPKLLHFSYQRYLENKIRETFGFHGVPLKLIFKRKGKIRL